MSACTSAIVALSLCATTTFGQPRPDGGFSELVARNSRNLRQAMVSIQIDPDPAASQRQIGVILGGALGRRGPSGRRGLWTRLAVFGGLVGGGALGAAIEGDRCQCDDPGFLGFVIGAPIGAFAAGILAWNLLK